MKNIFLGILYIVEHDSHRAYKLLIRIIYTWSTLNVFGKAILFQFSVTVPHVKKVTISCRIIIRKFFREQNN